MSHAKMLAKAWLDDSYRASLIAQGVEVPPRPDDLKDEELDTAAKAYVDSTGFVAKSAAPTDFC